MKTGGSYTRILGDLVWKKPSENRYIFNSAGWKLGLKNGRSFFKGKDLQIFYLLVFRNLFSNL